MPTRRSPVILVLASFSLLTWAAMAGVAEEKGTEPRALVGHTDPVYSVDFTSDGSRIVTGSFDKTLKLWDAATLKPLRTYAGAMVIPSRSC